MSQDEHELTPEELKRQQGEQLPDREAMSLIDANVAAPVNAAAALNVLSDDSTAIVGAKVEFELAVSDPNKRVSVAAPVNPLPPSALPGGERP